MNKQQKLYAQQTEFINVLCEESTAKNIEISIIEKIMKLARSHMRLAEVDCTFGLTPRQETRRDHIEARIEKLVEELGLTGVKFSGDPRGCTVKIVLPSGKTNDWGNIGYCVPTF